MTSKATIIIGTVLMIMIIGAVIMATNCELMPMGIAGWAF